MRTRPLQAFFRALTTQPPKGKLTNPATSINDSKPSNIEDSMIGFSIFAVGALAGGTAATAYFCHGLKEALRPK